MIQLTINGKPCTGNAGQTLLSVAIEHQIEIPHLCQDGLVEPYGACGLCVVEVEGVPKLLRACATVISEGMVVTTDTEKTTQSRKLALELLLSNHRGDCVAPCKLACPGDVDCQGYIGLIANGRWEEAVKIMKHSYPFPAALGRVCPHPCEDACRRQLKDEPIAIATLKQFAADLDLASGKPFLPLKSAPSGKKVAIVGGGPSGLTTAWFLAMDGHEVTVYEAMPKAGGMLRYGIPEYRLPKALLDQEIALVEAMGVKICTNQKLGEQITLSGLQEQYDAVYLAIGAWKSAPMRTPGEDKQGVLGGIDFLIDLGLGKRPQIGDNVAVVGGGNTAMDACRSAVRLGCKNVYLLYRRTRDEMPAEDIEIAEAMEEGVIFKFLVAPDQVLGDDKVTGIRLQQMELGEPDASGRRRPVPVEGGVEDLPLDTIIAAIGQKVVVSDVREVACTDWNTILADPDTFTTNLEGVFAGGDAINDGPSIAITAIGHAKKASVAISKFLKGEDMAVVKPFISEQKDLTAEDFAYRESAPREHMTHADPAVRRTNFEPVAFGFTVQQAEREASRCLECGCMDLYECALLKYARAYDVQPERIAGEMKKTEIDRRHPFIWRDNNKCVLCGLCVRVCDQVIGVDVIDLVGRGFETIIESGVGVPLQEANCRGCAQCVTVCPTGAMQERNTVTKAVPLPPTQTQSVCTFCGLGCKTNVHSFGNMPLKTVPVGDAQKSGSLCRQGRFGWQAGLREGKAENWKQLATEAASKLQAYGNAVGVVVGDHLTNEEIYLASKWAKKNNYRLYSAAAYAHGVADVLGMDGSTTSFDALLQTDCILLLGDGVIPHYPMLALRLKRGLKAGAKLALLSNEPSSLDAFAAYQAQLGTDTGFLKQVLKALDADSAAAVQAVTVTPAAQQIADALKSHDKAVLIFDRHAVTAEAAQIIAMIAAASGHLSGAGNGLIQLVRSNNSMGVANMGITQNADDLAADVQNGSIKAVISFGQQIQTSAPLVLLADSRSSDLNAQAFIPVAGFGETDGTVTGADNRVQRINPSFRTDAPGIIDVIGAMCGCDTCPNVDALTAELAQQVPLYAAALGKGAGFANLDGSDQRTCNVTYIAAQDAALFAESAQANLLNQVWMQQLAQLGLLEG